MIISRTIMMNRKRNNNELDGSFTVEAAIIIPLVTIIIFFIIYLGFYLHDRAKVQVKLHDVLVHGTNLIQYGIYPDGNISQEEKDFLYIYIDKKTEEKELIQEMLKEVFNHTLFIAKVENIKISTDISKLIIQGELVYETPISGLIRIFVNNRISIPFKLVETIFPREEKTRILDVALTTGKNVKGVNFFIDKLAAMVNKIK